MEIIEIQEKIKDECDNLEIDFNSLLNYQLSIKTQDKHSTSYIIDSVDDVYIDQNDEIIYLNIRLY